jgi:hypothetical protein
MIVQPVAVASIGFLILEGTLLGDRRSLEHAGT